MGLFRRKEKRDGTVTADEALLRSILNTDGIGKDEALNIPAVASCVDFIAGKIAELPIKLYREQGDETNEIKDDNRVALLNDSTGDLLTPFDMKKALITDYLLEGVGYIYPERKGNRIVSLRYIEKSKVSIVKSTDPIYKSAVFFVDKYRFYDWQLLRLCRNTHNGADGVGIVEQSRETLMIAYKSLLYEKYLIQNGGNKKGFLKSEKKLEKAAVEELKKAWRDLYSNNENNMMLLNGGIDFKESSNTFVEMQMNENKKSNNEYICQIFGLSPSVVSGTANDDTYISAIKTAVMPVIIAFQGALNQSLLLESERKEYYFVVDTTELLKGDILKRYQAYQIGLANNFLQPDEIRYKEDLKPLGFNFIKLGLQDVLLDLKTNTVYTPNTNKTTKFGESAENNTSIEETREGNNFIQDPETGQMQGSRPQGGSSKSGSGKSDKKDSKDVEKSDESGIINNSSAVSFKNEAQARAYIKSDKQSKKIFMGSQKKHIQGTKEYNDYVEKLKKVGKYGPSRLTITLQETQKIIDDCHGTGEIKLNKKGEIIGEKITVDRIVGISVNDLTGKEVNTNTFLIKYAKKGVHLIPTYPQKGGD